MFIEPIRRNLSSASFTVLSFPFCYFTWLFPKSSFSILPLENLDKVQISFLSGWSSLSCPLESSLCWSSPSRSTCHPWPTNNLMISHINVLRPLVILVIFSKMNSTLTVAMNPNWILHYTKSLDQSSQPQSFLRRLNYSHVLCLCHWKSNNILQLCLSTSDALSYREHTACRLSSLIKILA